MLAVVELELVVEFKGAGRSFCIDDSELRHDGRCSSCCSFIVVLVVLIPLQSVSSLLVLLYIISCESDGVLFDMRGDCSSICCVGC